MQIASYRFGAALSWRAHVLRARCCDDEAFWWRWLVARKPTEEPQERVAQLPGVQIAGDEVACTGQDHGLAAQRGQEICGPA